MKRYAAYIKPYLSAFLLAPLLMLTEVFGEILLPKFMSMIINNGVADRDTGYIIRMGIIMVLTAIVMAAGGIGGAYFSAKASICFTTRGFGSASFPRSPIRSLTRGQFPLPGRPLPMQRPTARTARSAWSAGTLTRAAIRTARSAVTL